MQIKQSLIDKYSKYYSCLNLRESLSELRSGGYFSTLEYVDKNYDLYIFITKKDSKQILFAHAIKNIKKDKKIGIFDDKSIFGRFVSNLDNLRNYVLHIICIDHGFDKKNKKEIEQFFCRLRKSFGSKNKTFTQLSSLVTINSFSIMVVFLSATIILLFKLFLLSMGNDLDFVDELGFVLSTVWFLSATITPMFIAISITAYLVFVAHYISARVNDGRQSTALIFIAFASLLPTVISYIFLVILLNLSTEELVSFFLYLYAVTFACSVLYYFIFEKDSVLCFSDIHKQKFKDIQLIVIIILVSAVVYLALLLSMNFYRNYFDSYFRENHNINNKTKNHVCRSVNLERPFFLPHIMHNYILISSTPSPKEITFSNEDEIKNVLYFGEKGGFISYYDEDIIATILNSREKIYKKICDKNDSFYPSYTKKLLLTGELTKYRITEVPMSKVESMKNISFYKSFCVDVNQSKWECDDNQTK